MTKCASGLAAMIAWIALIPVLSSQPDPGLPRSDPEALGLDIGRLRYIDEAVARALERKEIPGAVVLVARHGKIGYLKAFGNRVVRPALEPMTVDTIFDMASLTKVMATAPAVVLLVQDGSVRLGDRVKRYLPKFAGGGKDAITIRQVLTHYSGLRPDFDLSKKWEGYETALEELWKETTESEPGKEFKYSDLNFIALGEMVRAASGKPLNEFVRERLYGPLGMTETAFQPPREWLARIAPTESRSRSEAYLKGQPVGSADILRGEVHDPTAWRMGGVAGHAGLFSSARDAAIYAQMLLNKGIYRGIRVLTAPAVEAMTAAQSPKGAPAVRGLGWDIDSSYSSPRGDLWQAGYGHTGFTGTSLWVYPPHDLFVLILSNRVHPDGSGDATHLRGVIANIVASAVID